MAGALKIEVLLNCYLQQWVPAVEHFNGGSPSVAVRTPGTSLGHDGLTVFSPVAAFSLPHSQVGTSQLRNAVSVCPTFYPIALFGRHIPIFVYYNTIRLMSKDHVGPFHKERRVKAFQGIGAVYVNCVCGEVAI
jgi:hypothetical protein